MAKSKTFLTQLQNAEEKFLSFYNWFASRNRKDELVWTHPEGGKPLSHEDAVSAQKKICQADMSLEKETELKLKRQGAEQNVLTKARYIAKYIENGHSCVQNEPAIRSLVHAVNYLNSLPIQVRMITPGKKDRRR